MCAPVYSDRMQLRGDDEILGGVGPALEAELHGHGALVHHGADGHGVILAMVHEREVEHLGVFAGAAHELVGLDAVAVVGDGDDAGAFERADGSEGLALHAHGDATGRVNVDTGGACGGVLDELDGAGAVGHWGGVGHADHAGEAAGGGGAGAGLDSFLMRLAGLAEVNMNIHQAGGGDEAGGVDAAGLFWVGGGRACDEDAITQEELAGGFVAFGGGIDDAGVLNMKERHLI